MNINKIQNESIVQVTSFLAMQDDKWGHCFLWSLLVRSQGKQISLVSLLGTGNSYARCHIHNYHRWRDWGDRPNYFSSFFEGGLYFVRVNPRVSATQYYFILCCIFTLNITPTDGAPAVSEWKCWVIGSVEHILLQMLGNHSCSSLALWHTWG